jgi:hypothetical protein
LIDLAATFTAQLYDVRTKKDGGGRIQIDFGADALEEIQKIQKANGTGGINFEVAMVPIIGQHIVTGDFSPGWDGEVPLD